MSELETLKSHALVMAARDHASNCPAKATLPSGCRGARCDDAANGTEHEPHRWSLQLANGRNTIELPRWCAGHCAGCMTARERKLWRQIADEIGEHLVRPSEADQGALPL